MNKLFIIYILSFLYLPNTPELNYSCKENKFTERQNDRTSIVINSNSDRQKSRHSEDRYSLPDTKFSGLSIRNFLPLSIEHKGTGVFANISFADALMKFSGNLFYRSIIEFFLPPEDSILFLNDIQATDFIDPVQGDTLDFGTVISPQVSFTNNGSEAQINIPVRYMIIDSAGNEVYNDSAIITSIDTAETITISFPESFAFTEEGIYTISSYSELAGDEISSNDTITGYIAVLPLLHDIKPKLFVAPVTGDTLEFGTRIIPEASFKNNGSLAQTNVPVRYVITDSAGNEVYNQSSIISSIGLEETINVTFPESDSLNVSGEYSISVISELPGDQITSNDTLSGSIIVSPNPGDPAFTVNWTDRPVNFQLYPRESNDSGNVTFNGLINNHGAYYDTCLTKVYRNDILIRTTFQSLHYSGDTAGFSITDKIKSERSEYKIAFYLRRSLGLGDTLLYTADSVVAGDTYLINGQSNVYFAPTDGGLLNFRNEYIRTFGIMTDSLNSKVYNPKDTTWGRSSSYFNITSITEGHPGNVGGIGQFLQKLILDTFSIPTCFINGSVNNTSIKTHTRNNSNPTAFNTLYGKLLYRTQKAKLEKRIKAIIWFQGETDNSYSYSNPSLFNPRGVTDPNGYPAYFDSLYKSWVADYDFEKVYVFQLRQVACSYQNNQSRFREVQRKQQYVYHDTVQIIPTVGIGNRHNDNCHFLASGYAQLAQNLFRRLRQDFYSLPDTTDMRPPNILKAFYASSDKKQIGMIFGGSKPGSIPADSLGRNIKNYFYLNGVRTSAASSLTLSNDTLILTMPESQSATYLNYLPSQDSVNIYNGPFIRNSKGVAMLTFDSVYIEPYNGVPQNDIKASEFLMPLSGDTLAFGSKVIPKVSFKNNGSNSLTNVPVRYIMTDSTGYEIYNDSAVIPLIIFGETLNVTFSESSSLTSAGNYKIVSYSELSGDQILSNDSINGSITVAPLLNDIQASVFMSPVSGDTLEFGINFIPQVNFKNNGLNLQTNVLVRYTITDTTGNEVYNDSSFIPSMNTSETLTVTFSESAAFITSGKYFINARSELAGDQIAGNDSITGSITISPPTSKFVELRFYLEVMYPKFDTVKVWLAESISPYRIVDSSKVFSQSDDINFIAIPSFENTLPGNSYYLILNHRNSIEVWSANPVILNSDTISYNFTSTAENTFGNNTKLTGSNYCVYTGDINQDGVVELSDVTITFNASNSFTLGYVPSDVNGDNVTDLDDLVITSNNASAFVGKITP